jgi:hypothetical protein
VQIGENVKPVVIGLKTCFMEEQILEEAIEKISSGEYNLDELQDILQLVSMIIA